MIDQFGNTPIRDVTSHDLLDALVNESDDYVVRYYQVSIVGANGSAVPVETLRLTLGQLRRDVA